MRYIDRDELRRWIEGEIKSPSCPRGERPFGRRILMRIMTMPSTQLERKRGEWIYEGIRGRFPACRCSICGSVENADWAVVLNGANFYPNCGADMREESDNEIPN